MILIRDKNNKNFLSDLPSNSSNSGLPINEFGSVATIGNFDGLHKGHQAIFQQLKAKASLLKLPTVVITFEPLPWEFFRKNISHNIPPRLTRFKEKWHFLKNQGIDILMCLHFDKKLSQWNARQFVENILLNTLNVKHLVMGEDFRFGCEREGDLAFLQKYHSYFTIETASVLTFENQRISSTWIRETLQANHLDLAEKLLGRHYSLMGKVIHGDKRAREWGIPTANLNIHRSILPTVLPIKGVYAVLVDGLGKNNLPAVANVGRRPTVDGFRHLLEVHLLNFNENIYGKTIEVKFIKKLRDEKRFESIDLLKQQILQDVETAKIFLTQ